MDWLYILIPAAVVPFALRWIDESADREKARSKEGTLVFPKAKTSKLVGLAISVIVIIVLLSTESQPGLIAILFYLFMGFLLLMALFFYEGEIRVCQTHLQERFLFWRMSMPWGEIIGLEDPSSGKGFTIVGERMRIRVASAYVDKQRLRAEIVACAPALKRTSS
jgi:hypothetical protein